MKMNLIRSVMKSLCAVAIAFAYHNTLAAGTLVSTGVPRQVTLIDCYLSGERVGLSEFSEVAGVWFGSYLDISGKDVPTSNLLGIMVESCVKFLQLNKNATSVEYLVNLSCSSELRRGLEMEFVRGADRDNTPIGEFITKKDKIKGIMDAYFGRLDRYKALKQECQNKGVSLEPSVGEVKFRRDDETKGTLFSPTCGVVVARLKR